MSTQNHHELLSAHQESTARLFHVYTTTEHDVRECIYCGHIAENSSFLGDMPFADSFFLIPEQLKHATDNSSKVPKRFKNRTVDWYCAQQRNLKGVSSALSTLKTDSLPEWLLLQDDDTFINPVAMLALLASYESATPVALGNKYGGGAGFFLNKAALQMLTAPSPVLRLRWIEAESRWSASGNYTFLDLCILRQNGGSWCYLHSDHAIADCLSSLGIDLLNLGQKHMLQNNCPVASTRGGADPAQWTAELRTRLTYTHASCHRVDAATIRGLDSLLCDTILALNGTTADVSLAQFVPSTAGVDCAVEQKRKQKGNYLGVAGGVSVAVCASYCLLYDTCVGFSHTFSHIREDDNCYWKATSNSSVSVTHRRAGCEGGPNATWYARKP